MYIIVVSLFNRWFLVGSIPSTVCLSSEQLLDFIWKHWVALQSSITCVKTTNIMDCCTGTWYQATFTWDHFTSSHDVYNLSQSIFITHQITILFASGLFTSSIKNQTKKISQRQWLSCHGPCVDLPAIWRFLPVPCAQSLGFHAPRVLRHVAAVLVWWPCCPSLRHVPRRGSRNFQRPWKWKKLGKDMAE